jgi:hypothetical protein
MKYLTKGKIVLYLAAIFVAGGVTGAVISLRESGGKKWISPSPKGICDSFRNRLREELGLTPQQLERLEPLLQKRVTTMEEIRTRTVKELEELIRTSDAEIADALNLTADQRAKLEQMERRGREHFGKGHRGGPSPPPQQSE